MGLSPQDLSPNTVLPELDIEWRWRVWFYRGLGFIRVGIFVGSGWARVDQSNMVDVFRRVWASTYAPQIWVGPYIYGRFWKVDWVMFL